MVLVELPDGATIIHQGDLPKETDCIYLLTSGEVDIVIAGGGQAVSSESQQVKLTRTTFAVFLYVPLNMFYQSPLLAFYNTFKTFSVGPFDIPVPSAIVHTSLARLHLLFSTHSLHPSPPSPPLHPQRESNGTPLLSDTSKITHQTRSIFPLKEINHS
jgi:hypothetical protein